MANEIWQHEEQKFLQAIKDVKIPNSSLENVAVVIPKKACDLDVIPQSGGCHWIWTLEAELSIIYLVRPMPVGQE
jgi:hypothetical protein